MYAVDRKGSELRKGCKSCLGLSFRREKARYTMELSAIILLSKGGKGKHLLWSGAIPTGVAERRQFAWEAPCSLDNHRRR